VDVGEGVVAPGVFYIVDLEFEVGWDPGEFSLCCKFYEGIRSYQPGCIGERSHPITWDSGYKLLSQLIF
jgi:hypothetical protein